MFKETPADEKLSGLADTFCEEREGAVKNRKKLTALWAQLREQDAGMDEKSPSTRMEGAETLDGPISSVQTQTSREGRSSVVPNITRSYRIAGTARVVDILLPGSKLPFSVEPTPVSELGVLAGVLGEYPEAAAAVGAVPDLAERLARSDEQNKLAVEGSDALIRDWLVECDWANSTREQISEAGLIGIGVVKGPFPQKQDLSPDVEEFINRIPSLVEDPVTAETIQRRLENQLHYRPASEAIRAENCFPDFPHCGTDIQNGRFFFEKIPDVSERELFKLMEDESYFPEQIQACVDEGPRDEKGELKDKSGKKKHSFDLWVRTGDVKLEMLKEELVDENEPVERPAFLTTTLCNGRIIKIASPMIRKKIFPYWVFKWEPREGSWDGVGIVESMNTPQRGLTAAVRALMDNMGYAVGPQILFLEDMIEPVEGDNYQLHPYKWWKILKDTAGLDSIDDVRKAISLLEFPSYLNELMPIIQFWMKLAEDVTGLPLLLQGQAATNAVGVSNQLMNNTTTNLRLVIKRWDDKSCKPQVQCYYDWAQDYGPPSVKGDAKVKALGSAALIQRELQQQGALQMLDRSVQPVFGVSPKKLAEVYLQGNQLDPEQLKLTPEELKQLEAAAAEPDPKVKVADIEAAADKYETDKKAWLELLHLALKGQTSQLEYQKATEIADTQLTGQLAAAGMKEDEKKADVIPLEGKKPEGEAPPKAPGIEEQLDTLGFVS